MQIMERLSWLYQPQDFSAHPVIYKIIFSAMDTFAAEMLNYIKFNEIFIVIRNC